MVAELKDTLPDEVARMVERLRDPMAEYAGYEAADLIERLSAERDSYKAMIAAGEVKP